MSVTSEIVSAPVRASLAQQGIWFNERLGGIGTVYTMPFSVTFDGPLDAVALAAAWEGLVARHSVLARAVEERQGVPYLIPAVPPELRVVDTSRERIEELVRAEILRPFDLAAGPLARAVLYREGAGRATLLVVAHHIVFDGESTSVFLRDLAELYRAEVTGTPADLPELRQEEPEVGRIEAGLSFAREFWNSRWRQPAEVTLPGLSGETATSAGGASEGAVVEFALADEARQALTRVSEEIGASRFEIVLASLHALLYRYGNTEPTVAVDLGTRSPETRRHLGAFVNELPVTARIQPDWSFRRFVTDQRFGYGLRSDLRGLYRVRQVPLSRAVSGVRPGVSLAPVSLGYRRREAEPAFLGVDAHVEWALFNHMVRGAMRVHIVDGPDRFGVALQYDPRAMGRDDAERVAAHWRTLLAAVTAEPDAPLAGLPLLGAEETGLLLSDWNDTAVDYPELTLPELVAAQAARTPDATAVECGTDSMTYAELSAATDRLAVRLRAEGVGQGRLVAICAEYSQATLVGLLAVARAGGAYLPLDPGHPEERLRFVLEDSGAGLLLTDLATRDRLAGFELPTLVLEDPGAPAEAEEPAGLGRPAPEDLAYVIYTSGSTGRPKGVEIPHRALTNLLLAMRDRLGSRRGDGWLALTSLSFDISALELYLPLITGGRVVIVSGATARDGRELVRIAGCGVTHVQATPSGWRMLLDSGFDLPHVTALAGGEALPAPLGREILRRTGRLINVYGPTETTIWSMSAEITEPVTTVPIGEPLANTRVHVLDERLGLLPIGVPGELCIAGDGLADGYRNRPELTAERFADDPFGPGRLYRTGDRVLRRADGLIEFIGRLDDQIKLRGHRIEPGEIEARLLEHPQVRRAAVLARQDDKGERRLVAYLEAEAVPGDLREHCARTLPSYMIPSDFVCLSPLPLTANGKLDRSALPAPEWAGEREARAGSAGPVTYTGVAAELHEIWCEVLGVAEVGPEEDLFELGGHSLTITQIASRVRLRLGADLPLHVYYNDSTIQAVAAAVERLCGEG
ncbi:amino acid adenylation domain-containing protein [Streptosporangium sp. NPDC000509]|uniref:non-ribosomal peptide synthetase n=1 Tax=Streptosporangium sp. NPDC000509 TaxID=3366186 RepID=UPI0036AF2B90